MEFILCFKLSTRKTLLGEISKVYLCFLRNKYLNIYSCCTHRLPARFLERPAFWAPTEVRTAWIPWRGTYGPSQLPGSDRRWLLSSCRSAVTYYRNDIFLVWSSVYSDIKRKFVSVHFIKVYWGNRVIDPLILNLDSRRGKKGECKCVPRQADVAQEVPVG